MKQKTRSFLRSMCLLLTLLMLFSACDKGGTTSEDTTQSTEAPAVSEVLPYALSEFQIIRSDKASQTVTNAAMRLNRTVTEVLGERLPLYTDGYDGDRKPLEILVGATNREEAGEVVSSLSVGEYIIQTVKTEDSCKLILAGESDMLTDAAVSDFEELLRSGEYAAEGKLKCLSLKTDLLGQYENFELELGEPVAIALSNKSYGELGWGPYQFPHACYTTNGDIYVKWNMGNDVSNPSADPGILTGQREAVSEDGGKTWRQVTSKDIPLGSNVPLGNGQTFINFTSQKGNISVSDAPWLDKYEPAYVGKNRTIYIADDISEFEMTVPYTVRLSSGGTYARTAKINWPYAPLIVEYKDGSPYIYGVSNSFALANDRGVIEKDGVLYLSILSFGFDSSAASAEEAVSNMEYLDRDGKTKLSFCESYSVYIFKSEDDGATWDYISQLTPTKEIREQRDWNCPWEGFQEPQMEVMSDGSIVILMRSGRGNPCYFARSTDNGKTWSTPTIFDEEHKVGVYPNVLRLECGVSIATYGRPRIYVRATSDPTGVKWQSAVEIDLPKPPKGTIAGTVWDTSSAVFPKNELSCCNTYLLALDEKTALMFYSEFYHDDGTGTLQKALMVRTVTVVPK